MDVYFFFDYFAVYFFFDFVIHVLAWDFIHYYDQIFG